MRYEGCVISRYLCQFNIEKRSKYKTDRDIVIFINYLETTTNISDFKLISSILKILEKFIKIITTFFV